MANPFTVQPLGGLQNIQMIGQGMQGIAQNVQADREEERQRALMQEAQDVLATRDPRKIAQFSMANPEVGKLLQGSMKFLSGETERNFKDTAQQIVAGADPVPVLERRLAMLEQMGADSTATRRDLELAKQDPDEYRRFATEQYALRYGDEGVPGMGGNQMPARVRSFNELVDLAQNSPDKFVRDSAKRELGAMAKEGTLSSSERIAADKVIGEQVAAQEGREAAAQEGGKLEAKLALEPQVREAIKAAEARAQGRGEAEVNLIRAEAALPKLKEVVNNLTALTDIATYTTAGRIRDAVLKELGFGATEGATARAQIISTVDNTVLPLLRDTFGAAFTQAEGETLKKTLVDPDASPATKRAQLNAFLQNKLMEIETGRRRVDMFSPDAPFESEVEGEGEGQTPTKIKIDLQGNIVQ